MKKTWNSDQHSEKVRLFTVCYSIPHYWWTTSLGPSCCLNSLKSKLFLEFISTFTVMARNTSSIKVSEVTTVMEWWFLDGSRCYMFLGHKTARSIFISTTHLAFLKSHTEPSIRVVKKQATCPWWMASLQWVLGKKTSQDSPLGKLSLWLWDL